MQATAFNHLLQTTTATWSRATGELIRELTIDPTRDYQPTGAPKGPKRTTSRT